MLLLSKQHLGKGLSQGGGGWGVSGQSLNVCDWDLLMDIAVTGQTLELNCLRFNSRVCHLLAMWLQPNQLTFLGSNFPICEICIKLLDQETLHQMLQIYIYHIISFSIDTITHT